MNGTISTAVLGGSGEEAASDKGDVDINGAVTLAGAVTIDTSSEVEVRLILIIQLIKARHWSLNQAVEL